MQLAYSNGTQEGHGTGSAKGLVIVPGAAASRRHDFSAPAQVHKYRFSLYPAFE